MADPETSPTPTTSTVSTAAPGILTRETTAKPGWMTSEHALSIVALLLTAGYTTGAIPTDGLWAKLAAVLAVVLISLGYTVSRTLVKLGAFVLIVAFGLGAAPLVGCGPSAAQKEIRTALTVASTTEAAFAAFDAKRQAEIVAAAKTEPEGHAALLAYREKRARVLEAFGASYRAIALAAVASSPDAKSMGALLYAANIVEGALRDLGVQLP